MNILWCGGEDIDFPNGAAPTVETSSYLFRSSLNIRCALSNASYTSPSKSTAFSPITSGWLSFRAYVASTGYSYIKSVGFGKLGANIGALVIGGDSGGTKLTLWKLSGTTWTALASESGSSLASSTLYKFDINITNYGISSNVKVYMERVLLIDFTGDVTATGVSSVDSVWLFGPGSPWRVSEIIVSEEDTRLLSLCTLPINAAGDSNAFSGAFTDIDEVINSDADVMYTNTAGVDAQVNIADLPSGTFAIKAVKISARACKSTDASIGGLCLGVKSGGTINPGSSVAQAINFATSERIMAQNPVTANNWSPSDINNLQLNFRSAA